MASTHFHDVLHVGAVVSCKAPSGEFYMPLDHPPRKPIVLIASGVGITPSMSILDAYMHHFVQEEKKNNSKVLPIYLFYGERTVDQLAFKGHLDRLKAHPCVHIHYCISSPNPGEHAGVDFDHQGYVSVELMSNIVGTLDCDFYMCGSEKVMNSLKDQFSKRGVPPEQVHYEVLIPKTGVKKVDKDAPKYHIECSESDEEIIWQGGHECLLDLLKDEEIDVDYGCGQGKCGACATPVLEGEFKYTKKPTTSVQAGHCLPCICQPITDLKLDL